MKSIYISLYMFLIVCSSLFCLWKISTGDSGLDWLGAFVAAVAPTLFFMVILSRRFPRTGARLWGVTFVSFFGLISSATGLIYLNSAGPFTVALVTFAGWLIYLFWYSKYDEMASDVLVDGTKIPEFMAVDESGEKVSSFHFPGKNILFLFYRGNWCPFCMAQIREIAAQYEKIAALNTEIVFISPQPQKNSLVLAKRFALPIHFWTDLHGNAAKKLGISHPNGLPFGMQLLGYDADTVRATVFIRDSRNVLIYIDLTDNYRVRPEPEKFLSLLQQQA